MNILTVLSFIVSHPLNKAQRLRAVGRFLRWQFGSRLLPFPMALPFVDRLQLVVERGMTGATGNYYCGLHEAEDMGFVLHFLRPGDVFYDIGANIGSYTLLAASAGVTSIISFEPSTSTVAKLVRNISLNDLAKIIAVHQVALGAEAGEARFSLEADTTNHVIANNEAPSSFERVPLCRFDEFYSPGSPSFIKMDVEGFEAQVLAGASAALSDPALLGLLVEDNGSDRRYGKGASVSATVLAHGFSAFNYDPLTRVLRTADTASRQGGNILFLKDADDARKRVVSAHKFRLVNGWI